MTRPVSVVLPSLGNTDLLATALPPLLAEFEHRGLHDEAVVVDDTGEGVLAPWLAQHYPAERFPVRCVTRAENGGFAPALTDGLRAARHALAFSMNTDVRVRPGFLDPLVACLADDVFAVVPRVLLHGEDDRIESLTEMELVRGVASFRQRSLEPGSDPRTRAGPAQPTSVAFAVGGTVLFRVREVLDEGGFDPLFEPFYWEDIDLSWRAWRRGRRVVYQPGSVVEHQHRKTIGAVLSADLVTAALEKNHWLFQWKHLDEGELAEHVAALYARVLDAWTRDDRAPLVHLALALEQAGEALAARRPPADGEPRFRQICDASRPDHLV